MPVPGSTSRPNDARMAADKVMFGDDVPLYVAAARRFSGPVLELGAGAGCIAVAIAEAGFAIVGLECSKVMLASA